MPYSPAAVHGAVGMAEAAIARITVGVPPMPFRQCGDIVELDSERKAAMVSNLTGLCGDRVAQPVLNTGTLHR